MEAVIFDLWETLVPLPDSIRGAALLSTARALGEDTSLFRERWADERVHRETQPLPEFLATLRSAYSYHWTPEEITKAIDSRVNNFREAFSDLPSDTFSTLHELRRRGHPLGLISNCSSDVRQLIDESGLAACFDNVALSCELGVMKPDRRIFEYSLDQLQRHGGWYVGDGNDRELEGARATGLKDVLLDTGIAGHGTYRIQAISEIVNLVKEPSCVT